MTLLRHKPLTLSDLEFQQFQKFLVEFTGLYFPRERSHQLELALWDRLHTRGVGTYMEYFQLLRHHPARHPELRSLTDELTVQETFS